MKKLFERLFYIIAKPYLKRVNKECKYFLFKENQRYLNEKNALEERFIDLRPLRIKLQDEEKTIREEQDKLKAKHEEIREQQMVAAAWRPYVKEKKLNRSQERAFSEGVSETLLEGLEILAKERMRQLSNQAIVAAEGTIKQAKPMWCAVGVNMLLQDILEVCKLTERKEQRDMAKAKANADRTPPPADAPPRDVTHLYENPKL